MYPPKYGLCVAMFKKKTKTNQNTFNDNQIRQKKNEQFEIIENCLKATAGK